MIWDLRTILQGIVVAVSVGGVLATVVNEHKDTAVRLAEYDLRLTTLEHDRDNDRHATQAYQEEMRAAVARAVDLLTDVRLQIAKGGGRAK